MCAPALLLLAALATINSVKSADVFPWIEPSGINQAILICNGQPTNKAREKFADLANGRSQQIVVLQNNATEGEPAVSGLSALLWFTGPFDDNARGRMAEALSRQPDHVAVCLEQDAALAIAGRELRSVGAGQVHFALAASSGRPFWHQKLVTSERHDLTMLRRAAVERARADFPPIAPPAPAVQCGALVICGGGTMPAEVMARFLELAGGADAPIVVLPIAAGDTLPEDSSNDTRLLTRSGATNVRSLRARTLAEVSAPEFAAALQEAKGVWFSGGRQWRFVDAYLGTPAEKLLAGVLVRGGVIGGSSAGASIQGQYMPRGSPLGNTDMMAEGYERGLGYLPGVAIDQHFSARRRHADMTRLVTRYPQLLGIGIDEGTALIVRGSTAQILGRGSAFFYDHRTGPSTGPHDYRALAAGQSYDLQARQPPP